MFRRLKEIYFDSLYRVKRVGLLLIGGFLLVSTALMLLGGLMVYNATSDWPHAEGRLLKFNVLPLKKHPSHLQVELAFRYSVGDEDFDGQYFSPLTRPGKMLWWLAQARQDQYQVGGVVNVIYGPHDPSVGYLEAPNLFWDVLLVPVSVACLGAWMLYLFVKTRRRKVPAAIAFQRECRFSDSEKWRPIMQSVIERDHVVLQGVAAYSAAGGLFAGWPSCHVAIIASPNEFAVVPGPFTKRGVASSLLTLALEFSLSRVWLPGIHGTLFLVQMWRRRQHWRRMREQSFKELFAKTESIHLVSIDDAVVYGYEPSERRLWYRLPGQRMDDFIQLAPGESDRVDELIAYIGLMQNASFGD